ncbi:DUF7501 family protein [Haloarchaeobius sp. TZWWS8]|uniref:DUF7501 family protein n=1 Tax=Haloarchaeobius sp. TZWWS8 TaxID=3446121 RepID=UPI003EB7695F
MSQATDSAPTPTWSDPNTCPFCDAALTDPGAGFIDHLDESDHCDAGFELWRSHVTDDIGGGWSG